MKTTHSCLALTPALLLTFLICAGAPAGGQVEAEAQAQPQVMAGMSVPAAQMPGRNAKMEGVLHNARAFAGSGAGYTVQLIEKDGQIQVSHYAPRVSPTVLATGGGLQRCRIKDAIFAARTLINFSPTQFIAVSTRYLDPANSACFTEVQVTAKDITGLTVGTASLEDLIKNALVIEVGPGDNALSIMNKYLSIAERQMADSNFWEAEQTVDAALRATGSAPAEHSRLTQDMLNLAAGLDARGDLERAERVLKRVLEVRAQNGRLDDADAERTINHLTDLYFSDKRYAEATEMLNRLLSNPSLSESANPGVYANNLERLAVCHAKLKNYDQAIGEFNRVIALKRKNLGAYGGGLAMALEELGDTYQAQGNAALARENFKEAHAIYDHAVVSRSSHEKIDYQNYAAHVKQLDEKLSRKQ